MLIQPATERGVVVDEEGYFVAAWQWPEGQKPRLPRKPAAGTPRLILLTEPEALDPPSTKARWDFEAKVWNLPTLRLWVVDEKGNLRGGSFYWPERLPILQPGWLYVEQEPVKAAGRRSIYDPAAGAWKFPRRVFVGDPTTGLCHNVANENPRNDTENVPLPPGLARLGDDDAGLPVDAVHGIPISPGHMRRSDGVWRALGQDRVTKGSFAAALATAGLTAAFTAYLIDKGLQTAWNEAGNSAEFPVLSGYVYEFLKEQGLDADAILGVIDDATGVPTP